MGAFLSAIGGAGNAAAQYGQQVRGLLEERRRNLVDLAMHMGDTEIDPNARSQYFQSAADLLSNKPMEKIVPPFLKQLQTSHQGNQALAQAIGGTPQQPSAPPPGPAAPGQTPGASSSSTPSAPSPPASLPANNPLQAGGQLPDLSALGQQPIPSLPPPGGPSASAPVLTPPPQASASTAPGPVPFVYRSPREILAAYESLPEFQTPAGRTFLAPALTQELSHNEALGQEVALRQMDLGERRQALAKLQSSPEWASIPDFMKSQYELWASSRQAPLPALAASLMLPHAVGQVEPMSQVPPNERIDISGNPIDPTKTPYGRRYIDYANMRSYFVPATGPEETFSGPGGLVIAPKINGPVAAPGAGGPLLPPSAAIPKATGVDPATGQNKYLSPQEIAQGAQPGVNPSVLPSTSISQTPGEAPTTTVRTKGGIKSAGGGGAKASRGGSTSLTPSPGDPIVVQEYQDWVNGRGAPPTGKALAAVRAYAATNHLPAPVVLSPSGQTALRDIDPIITEVQRTREQLQAAITNGLSKGTLMRDYARYAYLHINGPDTALISNLSFAGLRSAAAAMKGTGSRAFPVLNRALEHTPVIGLNSDDPQMILTKLNEMESRLKEGRQAIVDEDRKSGVLPANLESGAASGVTKKKVYNPSTDDFK